MIDAAAGADGLLLECPQVRGGLARAGDPRRVGPDGAHQLGGGGGDPERWHKRLSATRSAASTALAGPSTRMTASPGSTTAPSGRSMTTRTAGSSSWNASAAASVPAIVPGSRATMAATQRASAGSNAMLVMSPARPRSSCRADRTIGSTSSIGSGSTGGIRLHSRRLGRHRRWRQLFSVRQGHPAGVLPMGGRLGVVAAPDARRDFRSP